MLAFITFVIQKIHASRRRPSAIRRAESQITPCIKLNLSAPLLASPFFSLDIRPPSAHVECVKVSNNCNVAEDEIFACDDEVSFYDDDDTTFSDGDGMLADDEDSLEQIGSSETRADLLSPTMSYDHEAENYFALWLAATNQLEGETLRGNEADCSVSDAVLMDIKALHFDVAPIVKSEEVQAAEADDAEEWPLFGVEYEDSSSDFYSDVESTETIPTVLWTFAHQPRYR